MSRALILAICLMCSGVAYAIQCEDLGSLEKRESFFRDLKFESRIFRGTALSERSKTSEMMIRVRYWLGEIRSLFGGRTVLLTSR